MINNNNKTNSNENKYTYNVEVLKVTSRTDDGKKIRFNAKVNGVSIYGMQYIEYVNQEGNDGAFISMPSYKGRDDKYYNIVWFPISKDLQTNIEKQLEQLLADK